MVRLHQIRADRAGNNSGPLSSEYKKRILGYLKSVPTSFDDPEKQARFDKEIPPKAELIKEFNLLIDQLEALQMDVVFSHNDLLLKNIIYNENKGTIHFIDYEYAFYNYAAFDIGNHFTEYAGVVDIDYSLYPTKNEQWPFLKHYLVCKAKAAGKSEDSVTEKDIERLYVQANKCACASHFLWGIWACIQAKYSAIDFDYIEFGYLRLNEYFECKKKFFPLQLPS